MEPKRLLEIPPAIIVVGEIGVDADIDYTVLADEQQTRSNGGETEHERVRTSRRTVHDLEGFERAKTCEAEIRLGFRKLVRTVNKLHLVPIEQEAELDEFIAWATRRAAEHNAQQRRHFVRVGSLLPLVVQSSSERAARQIAEQVQLTMAEMQGALAALDKDAIYAAVRKARTLVEFSGADIGGALGAAADAAWRAARSLTIEVEKKGRLVEEVREEWDLAAVDRARTLSLELAVPEELEAALTSVARPAERALDVTALAAAAPAPAAPAPRAIEM